MPVKRKIPNHGGVYFLRHSASAISATHEGIESSLSVSLTNTKDEKTGKWSSVVKMNGEFKGDDKEEETNHTVKVGVEAKGDIRKVNTGGEISYEYCSKTKELTKGGQGFVNMQFVFNNYLTKKGKDDVTQFGMEATYQQNLKTVNIPDETGNNAAEPTNINFDYKSAQVIIQAMRMNIKK